MGNAELHLPADAVVTTPDAVHGTDVRHSEGETTHSHPEDQAHAAPPHGCEVVQVTESRTIDMANGDVVINNAPPKVTVVEPKK